MVPAWNFLTERSITTRDLAGLTSAEIRIFWGRFSAAKNPVFL
jgi:hypothetical protein